jgi:hypothetical protein
MRFTNYKLTRSGNKYYKAIDDFYAQTNILECVEISESSAKFIISQNDINTFLKIEEDAKNSELPKIRNWFSAIEFDAGRLLIRLHFSGINFYDLNKESIDWELKPGDHIKLLVKFDSVVDTFDIRRPYFKIIQAKVYPEYFEESGDEVELEMD